MSETFIALFKLVPSIFSSAKAIAETADAVKRNAQLMDFQESLINLNSLIASVQQENSSLVREKGDLEDKLKRMETWEAEKQRYRLSPIYAGSLVFALQKSMSNNEPPHYLCTNCYKGGKPSILHGAQSRRNSRDFAFVCPICQSEALNGLAGPSQVKYAEELAKST